MWGKNRQDRARGSGNTQLQLKRAVIKNISEAYNQQFPSRSAPGGRPVNYPWVFLFNAVTLWLVFKPHLPNHTMFPLGITRSTKTASTIWPEICTVLCHPHRAASWFSHFWNLSPTLSRVMATPTEEQVFKKNNRFFHNFNVSTKGNYTT